VALSWIHPACYDRVVLHQDILEIRQYTLHPGARDTLIELFEREFIEPQERAGMSVIGQFRVLDDPDRFFWLRGFRTMESRATALGAFYGGPEWKQHRDTANATMIDSDNVLLMRPASERAGFAIDGSRGDLYVATIHYFDECSERAFAERFEHYLAPAIARSGATVAARFVTEHGLNTFPRLPVRKNEHAFAWFAAFEHAAAYQQVLARLESDDEWHQSVASAAIRETEIRRLSPTSRSRLR
jgi:hypothetical protein